MPRDPIPEPGKDACQNGALNLNWIRSIWRVCTRKHRIIMPPGFTGAVVLESNEDVTYDLSKVNFTANAASAIHPLYAFAANNAGTPRLGIYTGYVGGIIASSSMSPINDPFYYLTMASTAALQYAYAEVTVAYSTSLGTWSISACTIGHATSMPSPTSTKGYIQLARTNVVAVAAGYACTSVVSDVSGNQMFARNGSGTTYGDVYRLV